MRTTGLILIIVVLALAATITQAATFEVKQDGMGDFTAIQEAVDASIEGDTVIVHPGTYYENVEIGGRNIILRSTAPWDWNVVKATVIDGCGEGACVFFDGQERASCMLCGLTITNAAVRADPDYYTYAAVAVDRDSPMEPSVSISHCYVVGNNSSGIAQCSGDILNCVIEDNYYIGLHRCNRTISGCMISGNGYSGLGGCEGEISSCVVKDNTAQDLGGAAYGCDGTITNCLITSNYAPREAGGMWACNALIQNCTIVGNSAGMHWGGLRGPDDTIGTVKDCIIWGNSSPAGRDDQISGYEGEITCNCIQDWAGGGGGNISSYPEFVSGPFGDFYLSQTAAGQLVNSPCVDAGSGSASDKGLDYYTTRVDGVPDSGCVDMGFHYPNYVSADIEHYEAWNDIQTYSPGDTVRVFTRLENYGVRRTIDIYLGVIEPNGRVWTFTQNGSRQGNHCWYRGVQLPAPFTYPWLEVFQIQLPQGIPPGRYKFAIAIPESGGQLTPEDISYTTLEVAGE